MRNMVVRSLGFLSIGLAIGLLALIAQSGLARAAQSTTQPAGKETPAMQKRPSPASQPASTQPSKAPRVVMQTSMGTIVIELYPDKAPITVENFLKYVDSGFYNDTIFHRVIANFMIQGGGFATDKHEKKTDAPIQNEGKNGLKNVRGSIAMARTPNPNSATGQFFINVKDNPGLDYPSPDGFGYAVFGKVVEGMDVVDKIRAVPTGTDTLVTLDYGPRPFQDVPKTPVVIQSVRRQ